MGGCTGLKVSFTIDTNAAATLSCTAAAVSWMMDAASWMPDPNTCNKEDMGADESEGGMHWICIASSRLTFQQQHRSYYPTPLQQQQQQQAVGWQAAANSSKKDFRICTICEEEFTQTIKQKHRFG